jgi:hypothetical protein
MDRCHKQILTHLPKWVSSYRVLDAASKPGTADVETIWCTYFCCFCCCSVPRHPLMMWCCCCMPECVCTVVLDELGSSIALLPSNQSSKSNVVCRPLVCQTLPGAPACNVLWTTRRLVSGDSLRTTYPASSSASPSWLSQAPKP